MSGHAEGALLPHHTYWDESVYRTEIDQIFRRCWLFVGLAASFGPGDHSLNLAGTEVVLTATAADFQAVWAAGTAEIDRCGQLLFVKLTPGGEALSAALSPYFDALAMISSGLGAGDREDRITVAANWKGLVENTLDDAHAATVHTRTLQPAMDPHWLARYQPDRHGRHSAMGNDLGSADAAFWTRLARRLPLARHDDTTAYRHIFLFPNLYVATFFGALVIIHRIDPIGPETSALEMITSLHVTRAMTAAETALHRAVVADLAGKALKVVAEDIEICVLAQRGRHFAVYPGLLGTHERRVCDFQREVALMCPDALEGTHSAAVDS